MKAQSGKKARPVGDWDVGSLRVIALYSEAFDAKVKKRENSARNAHRLCIVLFCFFARAVSQYVDPARVFWRHMLKTRYAQNTLTICSGYSGDMLCLDMFWDMLELLHDILQIYFKYAYDICSDFCGICCFDGAR